MEFQSSNDRGFPHCCLRLSKVVWSEVENCCELTTEVRKMKMKTKNERRCGGDGDAIFSGGGLCYRKNISLA